MNAKRILRGTLILGIMAGMATAADPIPVKILPKDRRIASPVRPVEREQNKRVANASRVVRLSGMLNVVEGGALLNGQKVLVTPRTSIFPSPADGQSSDLSHLDGQNATAFGRRTARGVELTLVLVKDPNAERSSQADLTKPYIRFAGEDTGVLRPNAPH